MRGGEGPERPEERKGKGRREFSTAQNLEQDQGGMLGWIPKLRGGCPSQGRGDTSSAKSPGADSRSTKPNPTAYLLVCRGFFLPCPLSFPFCPLSFPLPPNHTTRPSQLLLFVCTTFLFVSLPCMSRDVESCPLLLLSGSGGLPMGSPRLPFLQLWERPRTRRPPSQVHGGASTAAFSSSLLS